MILISEEPSCSIVIIYGARRLNDGEQEVTVFIAGARSLRTSIIIVHLISTPTCDGLSSSSYIDCVRTAAMACFYSFMTCENFFTALFALYHFLVYF